MRIKFNKPDYYIYTGSKTVRCIITSKATIFGINYKTSVSADAVCNSDDKFDIELGMKLTLARAEIKSYTKWKQQFHKVIENIYKETGYMIESTEYKEFVSFANKVIKHNKKYIKEKTK